MNEVPRNIVSGEDEIQKIQKSATGKRNMIVEVWNKMYNKVLNSIDMSNFYMLPSRKLLFANGANKHLVACIP